jgi:hypothetical protein
MLPRKYARKFNNSINFKCTKCEAVHTYSCEEALKIALKPRKEGIAKDGEHCYLFGLDKRRVKVSYKYPCATCGKKTYQTPLNSFFNKEQFREVKFAALKNVGKIFLIAAVAISAALIKGNLPN